MSHSSSHFQEMHCIELSGMEGMATFYDDCIKSTDAHLIFASDHDAIPSENGYDIT